MTDIASRLQAAFADRHLVERELSRGGMATVEQVRAERARLLGNR